MTSATLHSFQRNGLVRFVNNTPLGDNTNVVSIYEGVISDHATFSVHVVTDQQLTITVRFLNTSSAIYNTNTFVIEPNYVPGVDPPPTTKTPIVSDLLNGTVMAEQVEILVQKTGVGTNTYFHISGYFTTL